MTVATSYEGIVAGHLADHGVDASVVHLDGAVETAIELGVAEVIADVVETGTSLRNAGLEVIGEPIMKSEAVVIRRTGRGRTGTPKVQQFLRRLQGVLVARTYVMMDYDCRVEQLERAVALTPGPGVADRLPAAQRGLGRRPRHGPRQGSPADHGRPVRDRRAGHPDHGHPRLPPLRSRYADVRPAELARPARHLPAGRTRAVLLAAGAAMFVVITAVALLLEKLGPGERLSFVFTGALLFGVLAMLSGRRSSPTRPASPWSTSPAAAAGLGGDPPGQSAPRDPWVFLDLSDGTSLPALGIQPGIARQRAIADARTLRALAEARSIQDSGGSPTQGTDDHHG